MEYKLKLVVYTRNNGDGSTGTTFFRDEEAAKKELGEALYKAINSMEDPYENGELDTVTMKLEILNGELYLAEELYIEVG